MEIPLILLHVALVAGEQSPADCSGDGTEVKKKALGDGLLQPQVGDPPQLVAWKATARDSPFAPDLNAFLCEPTDAYLDNLKRTYTAWPMPSLAWPNDCSILFFGTSLLRPAVSNLVVANGKRLTEVETYDVSWARDHGEDTSARRLVVNTTPWSLNAKRKRLSLRGSLTRMQFGGNLSVLVIDNHGLQMSTERVALEHFLRRFAFDAAFFEPPHPDLWLANAGWDGTQNKGRSATTRNYSSQDVLTGKAPTPSWWVDLESLGTEAALDSHESQQLAQQLYGLFSQQAALVTEVVPFAMFDKAASPATIRERKQHPTLISNEYLRGALCNKPPNVHYDLRWVCRPKNGHQCSPGNPTLIALEMARRLSEQCGLR